MKKIIIPVIAAAISILITYCASDQVTVDQYEKETKNQEAKLDTAPQDTTQGTIQDTVIQEPVVEPKVEQTIAGKYNVEGMSAAGAAYNGMVNIVKKGESYNLTMKLKAKTIKGMGTLDGNAFTVFWGKNRKFEYEVKDDGKIMSTWTKGQETFIPTEK